MRITVLIHVQQCTVDLSKDDPAMLICSDLYVNGLHGTEAACLPRQCLLQHIGIAGLASPKL